MGNSFTIYVDTAYTFEQRRSIGEAAVDFIVQRTRQGLGIDGVPLGSYSKAYKEHRDFKTGGKTGETTVNLTLTGDMLDSLQVLDVSVAGRIEIGYIDGPESEKSVWMEEKGYRFLGLSPSELDQVLANFDLPSRTLGQIILGLLDVG